MVFGAMVTDAAGPAEDEEDVDDMVEKPEPIGKQELLGVHGTCSAWPDELLARLKCASCCVVGVMPPVPWFMATALAAATEPKCEYWRHVASLLTSCCKRSRSRRISSRSRFRA